jgi:hypothetical protein
MAVPTVYTDLELQDYMLTSLGELGTALDLSVDSFYEAVTDVLLAYGVSDLAAATDIAKIRRLARAAALRVAATKAATFFDFTADGATFRKSQILGQIDKLASLWGVTLEPVEAGLECTVARLVYTTDLSYPAQPAAYLVEDADPYAD